MEVITFPGSALRQIIFVISIRAVPEGGWASYSDPSAGGDLYRVHRVAIDQLLEFQSLARSNITVTMR
jgi:hypothetical protein